MIFRHVRGSWFSGWVTRVPAAKGGVCLPGRSENDSFEQAPGPVSD